MIRVYKYGLLSPTHNDSVILQQLYLAHRYRNDQISIEEWRRSFVYAVEHKDAKLLVLEENFRQADEARKKASGAVKKSRAKTRTRAVSEDLSEALSLATEQKKAAGKSLAEYREKLRNNPQVIQNLSIVNGKPKSSGSRGVRNNKQPNNGEAAKLRRELSKESGVYWGTKHLVCKASQQSFKKTKMYDGADLRGLKHIRWDGTGNLGVQIQGGMSVEKLFEGNNYIRVNPVDPDAWREFSDDGEHKISRGIRRKKSRTVLHLRVDSEKGRPVWASWPMIMHRPIPDKAIIKEIAVSFQKIGPREEWSCMFTVDIPDVEPSVSIGGAVAIAFGWRDTVSGVQVATWMSSRGHTGRVLLKEGGPAVLDDDGGKCGIISKMRKAHDLKSIRDRKFDKMRDTLVDWLHGKEIPPWMREAAMNSHARYMAREKAGISRDDPLPIEMLPNSAQAILNLSRWKSEARLAAFTKQWAGKRFDGDSAIFGCRPVMGLDGKPIDGTGKGLEGWRYNDFHLWQYEAGQRKSSIRRRNDYYRKIAAQFADKYGTILLDNTKLEELAKKPSDDHVKGAAKPPQTNRQLTAPSILRSAIKNATLGRRRNLEEMDPEGTATTCPECGHKDAAQKGVDKNVFACIKCPFQADIGKTRVLNMLLRGGYGKEVKQIISRMKKVLLQGVEASSGRSMHP